MPVCRKETSVEVSRRDEEFLLCAGLWEFIARYLKVLYKVSSVLMPRPSGVFQGWGFPFVLLFACCAWYAKENYLEGPWLHWHRV